MFLFFLLIKCLFIFIIGFLMRIYIGYDVVIEIIIKEKNIENLLVMLILVRFVL